jgi:hypothetical protein
VTSGYNWPVSDPVFAADLFGLSQVLATCDWACSTMIGLFGPVSSRAERFGLGEICLYPRDRRLFNVVLAYVEGDDATATVGHVTTWLYERQLEVADLQAHLGEGHTPDPEPAGCGTAQLRAARNGNDIGMFGYTIFDRALPHLHIEAPFHYHNADPAWRVERVCWRPLRRGGVP